MRIKVKEVTKTVPTLVDPEPGWMSLVNHGANQEPFNALKSATGERNDEMGIKAKAAKREGVLTRMNFSKDNFKDEAAVTAFLETNSITDVEVEDEGDVFVAKSTTAKDRTDLEKAVSTRTKFAGVTAFIAAVKEADDTANDDQGGDGGDTTDTTGTDGKDDVTADKTKDTGTKGASKAKVVDGKAVSTKSDDATDTELRFPAEKYDFWGAYMSNEGSLLGVLKDGIDYDGVPPGVDEVVSALYYSTGNILSGSDTLDQKKAKLSQVGEDFAALAGGLYELFNQATEDSTKSANTERKAKAAAFVTSFSESVTRATKAADNVIAQPTDDTGKDDDKDKAGKNAVTVDIADANRTEESEEDRIARLVGKAMEPVAKQITELTQRAEAAEGQLARSTKRQSDQSVIDNLLDTENSEEDEEETAASTRKADVTERVQRMYGLTPRSNP